MAIKGKEVLVVGGAGFIGSHLVDALIEAGANVSVLDNLSGGQKDNLNPKAKFHQLDITKLDEIKPVFVGQDFVFHLAALPRVPYSIDHPIETNEANITGTLNVFLSAKEARVSRVVYSASSSAYGEQKTLPLVETMKPSPIHPYGVQKYVGELYAQVFSEVYGLKTVSLRYFNVYGPRQMVNGPYSAAIVKFLDQKKNHEPITIIGDGSQTRDFTHVSDVVSANILAALSDKVGQGEVINIGSGRNISILDIAKQIGGELVYLPARPEAKDSLADNTKAKELLGWEPQVSIEEGIKELKILAGLE